MQTILLVGCGDVARRLLPLLRPRFRVLALLRQPADAAGWRALGAQALIADLDHPHTLHRLAGLADHIVHLAPPPSTGSRDTRTRHLVAALAAGESLPRSLIYVSTTGVYGDCGGAQMDETQPRQPDSARAGRRVDAENVLRAFGRRRGVRVVILRAPGIYAEDRLPTARLQAGTPALTRDEDVYSNHIHADDLAAACAAALRRGQINRAINVVDDSDMKMGDYFDAVADALALPRPPRCSRQTIEQQLSPVQLSFMRESRRIKNQRLKQELGVRLAYPTVAATLNKLKESAC